MKRCKSVKVLIRRPTNKSVTQSSHPTRALAALLVKAHRAQVQERL